jgi:hypothetical protein
VVYIGPTPPNSTGDLDIQKPKQAVTTNKTHLKTF